MRGHAPIAVTMMLALSACKATPGGVRDQPPGLGAGCPNASDVYMASYLSPEEGSQGHTGWVLPLHNTVVPSVDGMAAYAQIDAAAAASAGVPAAPSNLWLLVPSGPPCKLTVGATYAAAINEGTPNVAYGVELSGCAAPPNPEEGSAIALVSTDAPSGCQAIAPRPVAERLGEQDAQGTWKRPTKETPMPSGFAGAVPPHPCEAPGCETLWAIAQISRDESPVAWAGAVNWLTIPDGAHPTTQCEWKVETFSGIFIPGPQGTAVKVTEGQDHPLALVAALVDCDAGAVLVAAGPGEYTTYDVSGGSATVGRHLVWLVPNEESFAQLDVLGPYCGM